jgi:hypothetical protein
VDSTEPEGAFTDEGIQAVARAWTRGAVAAVRGDREGAEAEFARFDVLVENPNLRRNPS